MAVRYVLRENKARGTDSNEHYAVVSPTNSYDLEDILAAMKQMGSTVGEADSLAVLTVFFDALLQKLFDGARCNLPWVSVFPTLKGKFTGAGDSYDAARHRLDISLDAGPKLLNEFQARAVTVKEVTALPVPILTLFRDITSGSGNGPAKSGGIGEIRGARLKYDPARPDEGVFFVKISDRSAVRVTISARNNPKSQTFQIPPLEATEYRLELRNRQYPTSPLRIGSLPQLLTGVP